MTELDGVLVRRKLTAIVRNLQDLGDIEGLSLGEYVAAVEEWLTGQGI